PVRRSSYPSLTRQNPADFSPDRRCVADGTAIVPSTPKNPGSGWAPDLPSPPHAHRTRTPAAAAAIFQTPAIVPPIARVGTLAALDVALPNGAEGRSGRARRPGRLRRSRRAPPPPH